MDTKTDTKSSLRILEGSICLMPVLISTVSNRFQAHYTTEAGRVGNPNCANI
jgi:hypothetical protein